MLRVTDPKTARAVVPLPFYATLARGYDIQERQQPKVRRSILIDIQAINIHTVRYVRRRREEVDACL
jgi:hypothetical protein